MRPELPCLRNWAFIRIRPSGNEEKDASMDIQETASAIVQFVKENETWAAPIAFLLAFAESLAFLSLVVPSTVILVGIGGLVGASGINLWPVVIAAGLGGSLGYSLSYWIGLYFKDDIEKYWPFRSHPEMVTRGREFFDKYGVLGVFLGHFFGPVRAVIPVVAGMYGMRQLPFQVANILSAFIWAGGVIAPSFFGLKWLSGS
jgi:membrane protein DedA with SNARE-associated domain